MKLAAPLMLAAAMSGAPDVEAASHVAQPAAEVRYRTVRVGAVDVFVREAGPEGAPAVLLLHGFPSSSFMFRDLIPRLATRYRVVAPDYPGFGLTEVPAQFQPSFDAYARLMLELVDELRLDEYALYVQDYGAPVGFRLALLAPRRVSAIVVQNGNAYEEGLSSEWQGLKAFWQEPSRENRERLRAWLNPEGIRQQYVAGVPARHLDRLSPDTWSLDWERLSRPGNIDLQLDLFADYRGNVVLYPQIQQFLRDRKPPLLIAWGRHDVYFTEAGARAYQRDVPDAELHLLDASHFALETHGAQIAGLMLEFLDRRVSRGE